VWAFKPTREGNTVVLALRTPARVTRAQLQAQAEQIEQRWPALPATRWVKALTLVS
jgi:spermidine synthase